MQGLGGKKDVGGVIANQIKILMDFLLLIFLSKQFATSFDVQSHNFGVIKERLKRKNVIKKAPKFSEKVWLKKVKFKKPAAKVNHH